MTPMANRQKWAEIVEKQALSGEFQIPWCKANDVNIHNFRYWKRRLKEENDSDEDKEPVWVALTNTVRSTEGEGISIKVGKASVEVSSDTDMLILEKILQVLMKHV